jgi:uncharacterized protein GlcG (DUF336 family)
MEPNVSAKMALTIAEAALAECGSRVSVAVVDRAGRLRVFVQGDGAAPHIIELARRKAYTASTFGRTSLEWAQRTETQVPGSGSSRMSSRSRAAFQSKSVKKLSAASASAAPRTVGRRKRLAAKPASPRWRIS